MHKKTINGITCDYQISQYGYSVTIAWRRADLVFRLTDNVSGGYRQPFFTLDVSKDGVELFDMRVNTSDTEIYIADEAFNVLTGIGKVVGCDVLLMAQALRRNALEILRRKREEKIIDDWTHIVV